jgi:hypothetical protein
LKTSSDRDPARMWRVVVIANLPANEQSVASCFSDVVLPIFSDFCFLQGVCEYMMLPSASLHLYMSACTSAVKKTADSRSKRVTLLVMSVSVFISLLRTREYIDRYSRMPTGTCTPSSMVFSEKVPFAFRFTQQAFVALAPAEY